jgi:histidinol-phosphate phosphatase family protein
VRDDVCGAIAAELAAGPVKRYVLLDRDGTLIRDVGYPHRLEDYELLDGVAPALRRLVDAGYRLAIVTNQSGIGRGYFGYSDFERFHARLLADLSAAGVSIDATFLCPHTPDDHCECRKPAPGLLWRAELATSRRRRRHRARHRSVARGCRCGWSRRARPPTRRHLPRPEAADRILAYGAP